MEGTDSFKTFLASLDRSIDELEPALENLLSEPLDHRLANLSSLQKIKVVNGYTYILASLLFAYLKTREVDTDKHEIKAELEKCKSYMNRAKELENVNTKEQLRKAEDQKLVDRFIKTQLSGNSTVVTGVQEPAISRVSFEGKHTKFQDDAGTDHRKLPAYQSKIKPSKSGKLDNITRVTKSEKSGKKKKKKVI